MTAGFAAPLSHAVGWTILDPATKWPTVMEAWGGEMATDNGHNIAKDKGETPQPLPGMFLISILKHMRMCMCLEVMVECARYHGERQLEAVNSWHSGRRVACSHAQRFPHPRSILNDTETPVSTKTTQVKTSLKRRQPAFAPMPLLRISFSPYDISTLTRSTTSKTCLHKARIYRDREPFPLPRVEEPACTDDGVGRSADNASTRM